MESLVYWGFGFGLIAALMEELDEEFIPTNLDSGFENWGEFLSVHNPVFWGGGFVDVGFWPE